MVYVWPAMQSLGGGDVGKFVHVICIKILHQDHNVILIITYDRFQTMTTV